MKEVRKNGKHVGLNEYIDSKKMQNKNYLGNLPSKVAKSWKLKGLLVYQFFMMVAYLEDAQFAVVISADILKT